MKRLKTNQVLLHVMLESAVSSLMLSETTLHLDCTDKGEFVEGVWNMVGRTCSNPERQQREKTILVQGSGEVNGQSFPMLCQSNSVQALSSCLQEQLRQKR